MNEERVNNYLELVPPEIRDAAAGLHDGKHWAVYIALLEKGETNFSAIKEEFGLEPTQTIRILRDLVEAGLVAQFTDDLRKEKRRERSFYKVTPIGQDFIESLMDRFLPQTSHHPQIEPSNGWVVGRLARSSISSPRRGIILEKTQKSRQHDHKNVADNL